MRHRIAFLHSSQKVFFYLVMDGSHYDQTTHNFLKTSESQHFIGVYYGTSSVLEAPAELRIMSRELSEDRRKKTPRFRK